MRSNVSHRVLDIIWLTTPTLIWSFFLHDVLICIDPLLLPYVERKLTPAKKLLLRTVWVLALLATLLQAWNITLGSYSFYFFEALPSSPPAVTCGVIATIAIQVWFVRARLGATKQSGSFAWIGARNLFILGVAMLVLKGLVATKLMDVPVYQTHVRSTAATTTHMFYNLMVRASPVPIIETPSETFSALVRSEPALPARVILMVVESWGETPSGLAQLSAEIASRGYSIRKSGFTSYRGSTLSGEFRELCSRYVLPTGGMLGDRTKLSCVPSFFSQAGYQTLAMHGYKSSFYARHVFWRRFGFNDFRFAEQLTSSPYCPGAFRGVCDETLIDLSLDWLDEQRVPSFLYILTLSSHEPLDLTALPKPGKHFRSIKVVHPTQIVARRAISRLLSGVADSTSAGCTLVYVAGDHQPPSASSAGNIFVPHHVPFIAAYHGCGSQPNISVLKAQSTRMFAPE